MKLIFMRHGEDTPAKRGGWSKEPLTQNGIKQINNSLKELYGIDIDFLLSSDLIRAVETSAILRSKLSINEIKYCEELREVNNGKLAGMDNKVANKTYPGLYWRTLEWDESYPHGESPREFYIRIKNFWSKFLNSYSDKSTILIVSHQGVFDVIQNIINKTEYNNKEVKYPIKSGEIIKINI